MPTVDLTTLAARILNPDRPRLTEARAAVEGIHDAGAAWERLVRAGFVPEAWRDEPRRQFTSLCDACGGMLVIIEYPSARNERELCARCGGKALLEGSHPSTVRGGVTIASGIEGLTTAETLARRVAMALGQPVERFRWTLEKKPESLHGTGWTRDVREALASRTARARKKEWRVLHTQLFHKLWPTFGAATDYVAEIEGLRRLWGEQQPNPFETVLELLSTGYVLMGISAAEAHLAAPMIEE